MWSRYVGIPTCAAVCSRIRVGVPTSSKNALSEFLHGITSL
ncbi:hypothetical protein LEP1GSC185_2762 [Leptospira licerasiae serovar Varillal str. VAR 010]|uniref:DUF1564 family protein n=1 Tax=Leptospira licerasiae str. MMD4847 TaxID=1049971 RepID=A0ABP2RBX0_9LEPT|nr:hypothetical protein LEP1GSC185_2762 [Leptospira licerasiae serovar Varillal str. VAR 010]EJZ42030.1 hypothetical protein LEP1GSC178_0537 [Leptospira licerasiae str. MMD4847]